MNLRQSYKELGQQYCQANRREDARIVKFPAKDANHIYNPQLNEIHYYMANCANGIARNEIVFNTR